MAELGLSQTLGQVMGNQAQSMEQPDVAQKLTQGVQAGVQLATMQDQVEQTKAKTEAMQTDLIQKQTNGLGNMLKSAVYSNNPKLRGMMLDRAEQYAAKANIPFDRNGLDAALSDDNTALQLKKGLNDVSSGKIPGEEFLKAVGDVPYMMDSLSQGTGLEESAKLQNAKDVAQIKGNISQERFENSQENSARKEYTGIINSPQVKSLMDLHKQGTKDTGLLEEARMTGKISLQNLTEIGLGLSKQINGVSGTSAMNEREAMQYQNANTALTKKINDFTASGVQEVNDPKLIEQLYTQTNRLTSANEELLKGEADKQAGRPSKIPYIQQQQQAAKKQILDQIEANKEATRFKGDTNGTQTFVSKLPPGSDMDKAMAAWQKVKGRKLTKDEQAMFSQGQ